ncbi:MAG: PrsW family intramembrane metalloprotease [Bacilli bacterium]|nr:PrsW family intramembrane metalloprotease [Bacilli bacterium]
MLSILVGIFPGIFFSILFFLLDKNRKEIKIPYLLMAFVGGCISSYLCYRLEWHFGSYFKKVAESNLFEVFFYALFGVAIFEEGSKLFFSILFLFLNRIKKKTNIMTYCVITSCGFLAFENAVFYASKYGLSTAISRLFTSSPSHVCFAIMMGLILSRKKDYNLKELWIVFLALFVPSILHAIYNTFLYQKIVSLYVYTYSFLAILVILCTMVVYKVYFQENN